MIPHFPVGTVPESRVEGPQGDVQVPLESQLRASAEKISGKLSAWEELTE